MLNSRSDRTLAILSDLLRQYLYHQRIICLLLITKLIYSKFIIIIIGQLYEQEKLIMGVVKYIQYVQVSHAHFIKRYCIWFKLKWSYIFHVYLLTEPILVANGSHGLIKYHKLKLKRTKLLRLILLFQL